MLIDRQQPGHGCSFGNAGLIADDHLLPLARPAVIRGVPRMLLEAHGPLRIRPAGVPALAPWLLRFARAARPAAVAAGTRALGSLLAHARPAFEAMVRDAGLGDLLLTPGALLVFETETGQRAAQADEGLLQAYGIPAHNLSAAQVRERVDGLAVPIAGARLYPAMRAVADPHVLVAGLVECFAARGGAIVRDEVAGLDLADPAQAGVLTSGGRLAASQVVVAAGLASPGLLRAAGVRVPLAAERGYHVMLEGGPALTEPITFLERGFVATPMRAGTRLAGTVEFGGGAPDWRRADILASHLHTLFPRHPAMVAGRSAGERPTTPDYLPVLGRLARTPRVIAAFGHQHLGLTLAALTADIVAALVAQDPVTAPPGANQTSNEHIIGVSLSATKPDVRTTTHAAQALDLTPFRAERFA